MSGWSFSAAVVEEVWQEEILLKLLNVVELPLLEGLLEGIQSTSPAQSDPEVTSSSNLDRLVLKAFRDSQWVLASERVMPFSMKFSLNSLSNTLQSQNRVWVMLNIQLCWTFLQKSDFNIKWEKKSTCINPVDSFIPGNFGMKINYVLQQGCLFLMNKF